MGDFQDGRNNSKRKFLGVIGFLEDKRLARSLDLWQRDELS
jgi:hypothetical protein